MSALRIMYSLHTKTYLLKGTEGFVLSQGTLSDLLSHGVGCNGHYEVRRVMVEVMVENRHYVLVVEVRHKADFNAQTVEGNSRHFPDSTLKQ